MTAATEVWTVESPDREGYHRVVNGPFHVLVPTSILDPVLADLNNIPADKNNRS